MQEINLRLKIIREELGYNQTQFADTLDITQAYLSYMEKGRKEVTLKLCTKLIEKYNVSLDWLVTGKGNKRLNS